MSSVARLLALLDLDALTELADALGLDVPDASRPERPSRLHDRQHSA
mgnify:CR=1 FL=1